MQIYCRFFFIGILSAVLMSGCGQDDTVLEQILKQENGILRGKVTIGPLCPVEPCSLSTEQIAQVYQARKVIIYEQSTQVKIATIDLRADGEYSFPLNPGKYIVDVSDAQGNELSLDLSKRPRLGNVMPTEIEVKAGDQTVVDFDIDTGIR